MPLLIILLKNQIKLNEKHKRKQEKWKTKKKKN